MSGTLDSFPEGMPQAYGEPLVFDLYALQGTPYQASLSKSTSGGSCTCEARFGDDIEDE